MGGFNLLRDEEGVRTLQHCGALGSTRSVRWLLMHRVLTDSSRDGRAHISLTITIKA